MNTSVRTLSNIKVSLTGMVAVLSLAVIGTLGFAHNASAGGDFQSSVYSGRSACQQAQRNAARYNQITQPCFFDGAVRGGYVYYYRPL